MAANRSSAESGLAETPGVRVPPFASALGGGALTGGLGGAPGPSPGRWAPAPDRPDPVALLEEQAASRVPQLVPIRYGRMLVSPFTFYRGAAAIMAAGVAATAV